MPDGASSGRRPAGAAGADARIGPVARVRVTTRKPTNHVMSDAPLAGREHDGTAPTARATRSPVSTRRRGRLWALLSLGALVPVACGGSSSVPTLKVRPVELAIEQSIRAGHGISTTVKCPANEPLKSGRRFTCSAALDVGAYPVSVVELNAKGGVSYSNSAPLRILNSHVVEQAIVASIRRERHLSSTVVCPASILQAKGLVFTCTARRNWVAARSRSPRPTEPPTSASSATEPPSSTARRRRAVGRRVDRGSTTLRGLRRSRPDGVRLVRTAHDRGAGPLRGGATHVALVFVKSGVVAAMQNVSVMADLPDWVARWLARQSRAIDAIERAPLLDRLPRAWLTRLAHAAALLGLLALGVRVNATIAWALIAIPMTVIVLLELAGWEPLRRESPTAERPAPFDVERAIVEPSFDVPIVVRRKQRLRVPEPLVGRARR